MRVLEEKEGEGECKNQIRHCCHHWDEGGREDLTIATPGRDDAHTICRMRIHGPGECTIGSWGGTWRSAGCGGR